MATSTSTRTTTQTSTLTKVVYVTRKVKADLLAILDTYGYFSESYAQDVIHDVRVFLDEEVIDRVKFVWTRPGSTYVLEELEYQVVSGDVGLADDRAGGIKYRYDLGGADFHVRITYNSRWKSIGAQGQAEIRSDLSLKWGSAGTLDYSGGRRVSDRTYSRDGYGLNRPRVTR